MANPPPPPREEVVDVLPGRGGRDWQPVLGEEILGLLEQVPAESRDTVRDETVSILRQCVSPRGPDANRTGLVVGYVQSGKTLSFTAVSALAQDNGYQLIVVITGTSVNLFKQSSDRLKDDLRLTGRERSWKYFTSDTLRPDEVRSIDVALRRWQGGGDPRDRQTVLITVMKNRAHLDRLIRILRALDLRGVPTLVIDDEADQAGLNNLVRTGRQSATYRRLLSVRQCLPHHTFLQYTATPQALLLIGLIDVLSPDFAEVLTPGPAYTGGRVFFEQNLRLVPVIPLNEVPTGDNVLAGPPPTLLDALRIFFLGVAAGILQRYPQSNRSMIVHPSQLTTQHQDFVHWVNQVMARWEGALDPRGQGTTDQQECLEEFRGAYDELSQTTNDLPSFQEVQGALHRAVSETIVTEVNARPRGGVGGTPHITWERDYSHILVGGQALDRGYTVEGLTVTYMPRGRGVGNADTVKQRARWFGYKAEYLGYCRVFLADVTRDDYRSYVEHEENVRVQLRRHKTTGRSLREWRRAFLLDLSLRPTRAAVVMQDPMRGNYSDEWYAPQSPHHAGGLEDNRRATDAFLTQLQLVDDQGDQRRLVDHRHLVAAHVPLETAYAQLLTELRMTSPNDLGRFTGLLLQIARYLDGHRDATCAVFRMRPRVTETRFRSVDDEDRLKNLFAGAYPVPRADIYPGDREIHDPERLTIQIHHLDEIRQGNHAGPVIGRDVRVAALWVPADFARGWAVQNEQD